MPPFVLPYIRMAYAGEDKSTDELTSYGLRLIARNVA